MTNDLDKKTAKAFGTALVSMLALVALLAVSGCSNYAGPGLYPTPSLPFQTAPQGAAFGAQPVVSQQACSAVFGAINNVQGYGACSTIATVINP